MIKGKFGIYEFEIYHNPYKVVCESDFILDMFDNTCLTLFNPLTTSNELMSICDSELCAYLILNHLMSLGYDIGILKHNILIPNSKDVIY